MINHALALPLRQPPQAIELLQGLFRRHLVGVEGGKGLEVTGRDERPAGRAWHTEIVERSISGDTSSLAVPSEKQPFIHVDDLMPQLTLERVAAYYGVPLPATSRTHCIAWSDWATQPKVELGRGIRYDMN